VFAAGGRTGLTGLDDTLASGRLAGLRAARSLVSGDGDGDGGPRPDLDAAIEELEARPLEPAARSLAPAKSRASGKQFACLCMDVTAKELAFAVAEGFDSLELLKRYTTLSMGPCQGKSCLTSSVRLCADVTGRTVAETGSTTARPPWAAVALRTLAAQELVPRGETPMHDRNAHRERTLMS